MAGSAGLTAYPLGGSSGGRDGAGEGLRPERLLRQLEWRVIRRLDGLLQGNYRSLFRGSGLDFTDLREYVPGDDPRRIEWNVTARLDEPWVREYVEDRDLTAWLVLDHSASMAFGPVERQKHLVLAEVATTLAHVLTRGGNRVGAVLLDRGVERVIPPASGRTQVLRIAGALLDKRAAGASEIASQGSSWRERRRGRRRTTGRGATQPYAVTDLGPALDHVARLARRRSLVVVVSDFIAQPGWEAPLGRVAQRHDVVALQVTDPREVELPDAGSIWVEDVETGEQIFVDTSDPSFRARLRAVAEARQDELVSLADARRRRPAQRRHRRGPRARAGEGLDPAATEAAMTLTWPWALLGLLAIPVLVLVHRRLLQAQAQRRAELAAQGLVLSGRPRDRLRQLAPALLLLALATLVVALSRPVAAIAQPTREGTVVLAFDVSGSMGADDVQPTRLAAAKAAARGFVEQQPASVRIGVVAFGGTAIVTARPTFDRSAVLAAISRLRAQGDTSLGEGILGSLSAIAGRPVKAPGDAETNTEETPLGYYGGTAVVLLTDGEDTGGPDPTELADLASTAGVRIETIGLGTTKGAIIEVDGFSLATALDAATLQKISQITGGTYHAATDAASLAQVYDSIEVQWVTRTLPREITSLVAGLAALLLLAGASVSVLRHGRVI